MTVAVLGICTSAALANNPGDPLFCQPNEGTTFLIVNGGSGVFTADPDCYGGNVNNDTHLNITTTNGTLVGTRTAGGINYIYTPSTSTFVGVDHFSIGVTTVFNGAGGPGSAGGTTFGTSGPATLNVSLNVIPGAVTVLDTPNSAIVLAVPAGSITGCGAQGNPGQGPPASAVSGCINQIIKGFGNVNPSHGTLTTSGNSLLYTPTLGFVGIDTFTYQATGVNTDGQHALNSGNVTVTMDVFHTIDTAVPSYNASALGVTLAPIFNGGTLLMDQAGATYSQGFSLSNAATNTINLAGNTATFSGVFSDATTGGNITIANSGSGGSAIFTGTNTYTGTTTINNGATLEVDGSIATSSLTTVNSGGMLLGTGTVGNTQVNSGGTFAPGSGTPGTSMAINGSLAFQSGAMYVVSLNPTTSSFATVTGAASLGGATVAAMFANGIYVAKKYTILTATGGVTGTFGSLVNTNLPSGFNTTLSYDASDVFLNLNLNFANQGGLNTNQQAVGNALSNFFNANGSIPLVYGTLSPAGLTQASGEVGTGSQQTTFQAMSMYMNLLTDRFMQQNGGTGLSPSATGFTEEDDEASAYAAKKKEKTDAFAMVTKAPSLVPQRRWSVWGAAFGGTQSTDGNAVTGSNFTTSSVAGAAAGADYRFTPDTLAGFSVAGGGTAFSIGNGLGNGRSDLFQAGVYARHTQGPAYITGALAYGWQDITTNRTVTIAGIDRLRAEFNANAYSGRAEGGYRFVAPWIGGIGLTPYAAAQFTTFQLPAYAEQVLSGAATFALANAARSVTDTRSELGLRSDKSFAMLDGILTLRGRLAWAHDYDPNRTISPTFQALPGASFVVNGAAQASDSALTTASAEMKWVNGWSAAATFEGEFSNVTRSYAGKGVVRYQW
ncbi:MAG TPA: autotransporter domain-containing protein [Bradyrhizobium sp.]